MTYKYLYAHVYPKFHQFELSIQRVTRKMNAIERNEFDYEIKQNVLNPNQRQLIEDARKIKEKITQLNAGKLGKRGKF